MSEPRADRMTRVVEMMDRLIGYDTTSRNSNLALIEDVQSYLSDLGVVSRIVHDETGTKANLWATIGPIDKGGVVLSGHTDVVPIDGQDWSGIQITTAAGVCGVVDLMREGKLPTSGLVRMEQVSYPDFLANRFGQYYA